MPSFQSRALRFFSEFNLFYVHPERNEGIQGGLATAGVTCHARAHRALKGNPFQILGSGMRGHGIAV
jgi:hypothetical protein